MARQFKPTFRNSQEAFGDAIRNGHLSDNRRDAVYAGRFMYMYTEHKGAARVDAFKNSETRKYLFIPS